MTHGTGHSAQRSRAALACDVAFDTSSQSHVSFYSQDAPHFRYRRDLISEMKFHFSDKVGSNSLVPTGCRQQKKIVNFYTHEKALVNRKPSATGIGSPQFACYYKMRRSSLTTV